MARDETCCGRQRSAQIPIVLLHPCCQEPLAVDCFLMLRWKVKEKVQGMWRKERCNIAAIGGGPGSEVGGCRSNCVTLTGRAGDRTVSHDPGPGKRGCTEGMNNSFILRDFLAQTTAFNFFIADLEIGWSKVRASLEQRVQ